MSPSDVNYNRQYYQNTFISTTRAMSDYLLKPRYVYEGMNVYLYTTHITYRLKAVYNFIE